MGDTIVFTGGGTAGHVFPGLSVIEELRCLTDAEIVWIGSSSGMERGIVEKAGVRFIGIPSGKLRRYFSLKNFSDVFRIAAGMVKAFFIMRKLRPVFVFSKGGYVSVPPVAAAGLMHIPVFSHESDYSPGLATRLNSRFSERILTAFSETVSMLPEGKAVVTGNPVRSAVYKADAVRGREWAGLGSGPGKDRKLILVMGGSQGALQINRLIESIVPELLEDAVVVHQMGAVSYRESVTDGYICRDFISDELPDIMAAADLIISRAGASAVWEIATLGRASILIPLGTAGSRGDQIMNAEVFDKAGAACVLTGEVSAAMLLEKVRLILGDDLLRAGMGKAAAGLADGNASERIAGMIIERIR